MKDGLNAGAAVEAAAFSVVLSTAFAASAPAFAGGGGGGGATTDTATTDRVTPPTAKMLSAPRMAWAPTTTVLADRMGASLASMAPRGANR